MVKLEKKRRPRRADVRKKSQLTAHGPSLLRLPAEVRNEIYTLVLSTACSVRRTRPGVSRSKKKPMFCEIHDHGRVFNQLKYVNRQLYAETAGIETQCTQLVFDNAKPQASTRMFLLFGKRCAPTKLAWLRYVVIKEKPWKEGGDVMHYLKANMRAVVDLFKFCAVNTHITIEYRVPNWSLVDAAKDPFAAYRFLNRGLIMELLFRNEDNSKYACCAGRGR